VTERTLEQIEAEMQALKKEHEEMLEKTKEEDFKLVKEKIKLHGFTRTSLRSAFPTKRKSKRKSSAPKKP